MKLSVSLKQVGMRIVARRFRTTDSASERTPKLLAYITHSKTEIFEAQRLRYAVFTEEYGAKIRSLIKIDRDRFDKHCTHVVVRDTRTNKLVGYTRLLCETKSIKTNGFYSETEFLLNDLRRVDGKLLEIGRTCIHPDYRTGATILLLWAKVAEFLLQNGYTKLIGCASVSMADGGLTLAAIMKNLRTADLIHTSVDALPRVPVALTDMTQVEGVDMPPLLKAYLRMGAKICGEPFWDKDFNVADLFVLLDIKDLPPRYVQHYLSPTSKTISPLAA